MLVCGDWRQTSPIVQFGAAADSIDAAFITSDLWSHNIRIPGMRLRHIKEINTTLYTRPLFGQLERAVSSCLAFLVGQR